MDEKDLIRLQNLQQQLQSFSLQKQNLQLQAVEYENALKELQNSKEVYKIVGSIMVKKNKEEVEKELKEKKELNDMRLESYNKQIKKITEEIQELQKKLLSKK